MFLMSVVESSTNVTTPSDSIVTSPSYAVAITSLTSAKTVLFVENDAITSPVSFACATIGSMIWFWLKFEATNVNIAVVSLFTSTATTPYAS